VPRATHERVYCHGCVFFAKYFRDFFFIMVHYRMPDRTVPGTCQKTNHELKFFFFLRLCVGLLCMAPEQVNECGLVLHHFGTIVYDKAKFSKVRPLALLLSPSSSPISFVFRLCPSRVFPASLFLSRLSHLLSQVGICSFGAPLVAWHHQIRIDLYIAATRDLAAH
jgi:hypothetical protein